MQQSAKILTREASTVHAESHRMQVGFFLQKAAGDDRLRHSVPISCRGITLGFTDACFVSCHCQPPPRFLMSVTLLWINCPCVSFRLCSAESSVSCWVNRFCSLALPARPMRFRYSGNPGDTRMKRSEANLR